MSQLFVPPTLTPNSAIDRPDCAIPDCRSISKPASLELPTHVPVPRATILQEMSLLARSIGRPVEIANGVSRDAVGFLIPDFALLLLGTACWRPLLCEEAQEIGEQHQLNVAILRSDDRDFLGSKATSLDLLLIGSKAWLSRLKPWRRTVSDDLWFAPIQGEGKAVRLSSGLMAISPRAPFTSLFEREYGFEIAQSVSREQPGQSVEGASNG